MTAIYRTYERTQCLSCFCYLADTSLSLLQYAIKLQFVLKNSNKILDIYDISRESLTVSRDPYRMPVSRSPGHRWLRVFPWWLLTFSCKSSPPPAFRRGDNGTSGNAFIVRRKMYVLSASSGLTPLHDRVPAHFRGLSRENRTSWKHCARNIDDHPRPPLRTNAVTCPPVRRKTVAVAVATRCRFCHHRHWREIVVPFESRSRTN